MTPATSENLPLTALPEAPFAQGGVDDSLPVLHLINGEYYSGAERVQDLLAERLPDFGFRAELACVKPGAFVRHRQSRAPLYETPMRGRLDLRPLRQLVRLVRRQDYRLIHAHTPRTAMLGALVSRFTGVPLVYHLHSPASRDSTRRWRNWLNGVIERMSLRRAAALVAVSQSLADQAVRDGWDARRLYVVPNGVPCRTVRPPRPESQTTWTLGTVALFRPRKGIEVLLEATAILRSQGWDARLRAVGGFETAAYQRQVKDYAQRLGLDGTIDWIGFTPDVDRQLAQMDLFVLPSLFGEGMPMVVLEAMAAGVPVVASRVEGIPEVIRDGKEGLLVEPRDAQALAGRIGCLLRKEFSWSCLQSAAAQRQGQRFSDRSMACGVAEAYRSVLAAVGDRRAGREDRLA